MVRTRVVVVPKGRDPAEKFVPCVYFPNMEWAKKMYTLSIADPVDFYIATETYEISE